MTLLIRARDPRARRIDVVPGTTRQPGCQDGCALGCECAPDRMEQLREMAARHPQAGQAEQGVDFGFAQPTFKGQGEGQRLDARPKLPVIAGRQRGQIAAVRTGRIPGLFAEADRLGGQVQVLDDNGLVALEDQIGRQALPIQRTYRGAVNAELGVLAARGAWLGHRALGFRGDRTQPLGRADARLALLATQVIIFIAKPLDLRCLLLNFGREILDLVHEEPDDGAERLVLDRCRVKAIKHRLSIGRWPAESMPALDY